LDFIRIKIYCVWSDTIKKRKKMTYQVRENFHKSQVMNIERTLTINLVIKRNN
jgi:hypothetical protein